MMPSPALNVKLVALERRLSTSQTEDGEGQELSLTADSPAKENATTQFPCTLLELTPPTSFPCQTMLQLRLI